MELPTSPPRALTPSALAPATAPATRDRSVCSDGGVKIVVVASVANRTGFVLTREAFAVMMARPCVSSDDQLLPGLGGNVVQVDFRRIPCEYKNRNLLVRIGEEASRHPAHLAITFLYQGGQTDIATLELSHVHTQTTSAQPSSCTVAERRAHVVTEFARAEEKRVGDAAGRGRRYEEYMKRRDERLCQELVLVNHLC